MYKQSFFYTDSSNFKPGDYFFSGYGVSDKEVIIGAEGYKQYRCEDGVSGGEHRIPRRGRFVGCFPLDHRTIIRTDDMGQELLYMYKASPRDWAVSNSFWLLISNLKARGKKLTFLDEAFSAFSLKSGKHIGEQLLSHKTPVNEVVLIPATQDVVISHCDASINVEGLLPFDYMKSLTGSVQDLILAHFEEQRGIISSLNKANFEIQCDLSGGYDSRLCFGLCQLSLGNDFFIHSLENRLEDYRIASKITEDYGVEVNKKLSKSSHSPKFHMLSSEASVDLWELSCGGVYLPVYPIRKTSESASSQVSVGGDVSYGYSFYEGKAKFNGTVEKIYSDIKNSFSVEEKGERVADLFYEGIEETGIQKTHPAALQLHYSSYRARAHAGRNSYKFMNGRLRLTPLTSSRIMAASIKIAETGEDKNNLLRDMYALINPYLTQYEFSGGRKSVKYDEVLQSELFGVEVSEKNYKVYYDPGSSQGDSQEWLGVDWRRNSDSFFPEVTDDAFKRKMASRLLEISKYVPHKDDISEKSTLESYGFFEESKSLSHQCREYTREYFLSKINFLLNS